MTKTRRTPRTRSTGTPHAALYLPPAPVKDRRANVFVVGFHDHQRRHLERLDPDGHYSFHTLVAYEQLRRAKKVPVARLLGEAEDQLDGFPEPVDGITSFLDFPGIEMAAFLAAQRSLPGPSLEAVLRCNHKLWSRRLQAELVPELCPRFSWVDPFDEDPLGKLEAQTAYPFWIKPLNAYASYLGFRIDGPSDFQEALPKVRGNLHRLGQPLEHFMELAAVPDDLKRMGGSILIAEEIVTGSQCTLEGYVYRGTPRIYGVVDSIRVADGSSFARYEYPSQLPVELQDRMAGAARRFMCYIEFDDGQFNMEFFYDQEHDQLWLLEVNPRLSQSHLALFEKVDGASHQAVAIRIAMGQKPEMPHRQGEYPHAAKFFLRAWRDAQVIRVPGPEELERIEAQVPGSSIIIRVGEGMRLSDIRDQDSYSYELAWIWIGGQDHADLMNKYEKVKELLDIELEDGPDAPH
jgi:hypothetical protein